MTGPLWDSENSNMHPTCDARSHLLSGQEVAFINRTRNQTERLSQADNLELRRLWDKVDGANPI